MASPAPPVIFSPRRRRAAQARGCRRQDSPDAASYIRDDMAEDMVERLAFLRHAPRLALLFGAEGTELPARLATQGCDVMAPEGIDEESPFPATGFDLVASLARLDTLNDLPGALIHIRNALAPGGLLLASFTGAGSLPMLRAAMLAADGERPAPRLHPQIDVRAGAQLLQRAGFADPVADTRSLEVRFRSLDQLACDLRDQALGNVLARPGPPLDRKAWQVARAAFGQGTCDNFEIITLSGFKR